MKPGDHLVVPLFAGLTHHGIYLGKRRVIHWDSGLPGRVRLLALLFGPTKVCVRETSLARFASRRRPRVRRYRLALDAATVVARARSRVGERGYDPLTNNCEQLATWCKTARHDSRQVRTARGRALVAAALLFGAVVGHTAGNVTAIAGACVGLIVAVCGLWLRRRVSRRPLPQTEECSGG